MKNKMNTLIKIDELMPIVEKLNKSQITKGKAINLISDKVNHRLFDTNEQNLKYILEALQYGLLDCTDNSGNIEKQYNIFQNCIDLVKKMQSSISVKCENPHCIDGVVDEIYGEKQYCSVCNKL